MNKLPRSRAASGLLRALLDRAASDRDRILLTEIQSDDWQSLTLTGERHLIKLRICGPKAGRIAESLTAGLEDAEFSIRGQIVADIVIGEKRTAESDGSISLAIEALTVAE